MTHKIKDTHLETNKKLLGPRTLKTHALTFSLAERRKMWALSRNNIGRLILSLIGLNLSLIFSAALMTDLADQKTIL